MKRPECRVKRIDEIDIVASCKNNPNSFFIFINNSKEIISGIGRRSGSDGKLVTENLSVADFLDNYFSSVFKIALPNTSTTNINEKNVINDENVINVNPVHQLLNFEIITNEVLEFLQTLTTNKSPGPDNVYYELLKETKREISLPLTALFNSSLVKGIGPSDWKTTNVTPIFQERHNSTG